MLNKYMLRGLWLFITGIALIALGYYLKEQEWFKYGWAMILGYVAFGCGVMYIVYSLIRKIERRSLLEDRAERLEAGRAENNPKA